MKLNIKNGRDGVSPSLNNESATCQPSCHQRGVALVITLVMLSVITFMAITFLVLSRRERGSVTTATDQTTARFTADTALERAKAEMLGNIIAFTNAQNYDLLVSTNFINYNGFDNNPPLNSNPYTNVNYDYLNNPKGASLNTVLGALERNLGNLLYNPRPPVIISNAVLGRNEFRFYLDLNRNGRYDTNGFWPVIGRTGGFLHPDGTEDSNPANGITNHFVGDPEWIGVLEFPERPHSPTNRFLARYAYMVLPVGKTLDLNSIHNHAKQTAFNNDGFLRNQGVGTWEINLAAFLADLNTNYWWAGIPSDYNYNFSSPFITSSAGAAFVNANSLLSYRYNGGYGNLAPANALLGNAATLADDNIDEYSDGPLMGSASVDESIPANQDNRFLPWAGADNTNHFFSVQDLFDPAKTAINNTPGMTNLTDRLKDAGNKIDSYNRYTYYRLLSQLGTDSAPEQDKININYKNVNASGNVVVGMETNLTRWTPIEFFTNTVNRLIKDYTADWLNSNSNAFYAIYRSSTSFGINIPVYNGSTYVYSSSVNRLLQLAANIFEATTNSIYPNIYRPYFSRQGTNIYISGFDLVNPLTPPLSTPIDLSDIANQSLIPVNIDTRINVYGVPWIFGGKTGFPNFNEVAMQGNFQVTRRLKMTRGSVSETPAQHKMYQEFLMSMTNVVAAEAWNSYRSNYSVPVEISVTNDFSFVLTNSDNLQFSNRFTVSGTTTKNPWTGYGTKQTPAAGSFAIPLYTNLPVIRLSVYSHNNRAFYPTNSFPFDFVTADSAAVRWGIAITNRVSIVIRETTTRRLLDYVQLNGIGTVRDLSQELQRKQQADPPGFDSLWVTNAASGEPLPVGILNQRDISLGNYEGSGGVDWNNYGINQYSGATKDKEIVGFRAFYFGSAQTYKSLTIQNPTNLEWQLPFTPTRITSQPITWQVNDPFVHYLSSDLVELNKTNIDYPKPNSVLSNVVNIGFLNDRYNPWGGKPGKGSEGDPKALNIALKDPLITSSDRWSFPTNVFPGLGWLGRVHRGTPWQTVYLKSSDISRSDFVSWREWAGIVNDVTATNLLPVSDRNLFDVFTTAVNENATRGQLSVNVGSGQTNDLYAGLAAWSAALSGVITLSNTITGPVPVVIDPAGVFNPTALPALAQIVQGINQTRTNRALFPFQVFNSAGDILATPQLTYSSEVPGDHSPFLDTTKDEAGNFLAPITDEVMERIPQQIMSLLSVSHAPRFVIYSYGQTLHPADHSLVIGGGLNGLCTNYQITAETATRAVVRVEGAPQNPKIVVEQFNVLPPD